MSKVYIYKLIINDKYYIGSSNNIQRRWSEHKNCCFNDNNKEHNRKLYKYIRNCGITKKNFKERVIKKIIVYSNNNDFKKYENMFINLKDINCLNSNRENQNVKGNKKEYDIKRKKHKCYLCNTNLMIKKDFNRHMNTKKHLFNDCREILSDFMESF